MKKETPHKAPHPVDAYFRDQEANIPLGLEDAHWAALQAMLHNSKRPADAPGGNNEPDGVANLPGSSAFRLFSILAIVLLICSTTWILVADQQSQPEPATTDSFEYKMPGATVGTMPSGTLKNSNSAQQTGGQAGAMEIGSEAIQTQISAPANGTMAAQGLVDTIQLVSNAIPAIALPDSLKAPAPEKEIKEAPAKARKKKHLAW